MMRRPMARRPVGRGGLVGTAARTAVVAGTATAVVGGMSRHQASKAEEAAQAQAYQQEQQAAAMQAAAEQAVAQQQAAAAAAAPPPPPAGDPTIAELERLATLKQQGILSDEEFAAAKAKVLGIG
jgi:multidrug resistance efflux pump